MVLAVAILPEALTAVALEIERRGVKEDDIHGGEQIAAAGEELFLDEILGAAWHELRRTLLLFFGQGLA